MSRPAARRLLGFDGLRALAAMMVLTYHVCLAGGWSRHGALAPIVAELKAGVGVFFVISGCVLYLPHARAVRGGPPASDWRTYARRRAARILPAYWVALTVFAVVSPPAGVFTSDWWRLYGLAQIYEWGTLARGLGVAWSLCVEVTFYMALPLLAAGIAWAARTRPHSPPHRRELAAVALACGGTLGFRLLAAGSAVAPVPGPFVLLATSLVGLIDWFAVGIALAALAASWEQRPHALAPLAALARHPGVCWLLAALSYLLGAAAERRDLFLPVYGVATHVAIGAVGALLALPLIGPDVHTRRGPLLSLVRCRPASWLGTVSYGIYLWQLPVLDAIRGGLTARGAPLSAAALVLLFAQVAAGAVSLAAVSWRLVELPVQRAARAQASAWRRVADSSAGRRGGGRPAAVVQPPIGALNSAARAADE